MLLQTFLNCGDPAHLAHLLQFEDVLIELIQLNEDFTQDGTVLAFYQVSARDFLYPEDSLLPSYAESDREVLMHKKIWFSVSIEITADITDNFQLPNLRLCTEWKHDCIT